MGFFSKIKDSLKKTKETMIKQVETVLSSFSKINEDLFNELEETLIMSDVGYDTSTYICSVLKKKVKEKNIVDPENVKNLLCDVITEMLDYQDANLIDSPEYAFDKNDKLIENSNELLTKKIILVIGVNGVGKTTTIGKLAYTLKTSGKRVVLGAADTFRAAAINQLKIWADRAGVEFVSNKENTDPASVVFDTILFAKKNHYDIVICDTAGRLHNKKNLMDELAKISRIIKKESNNFKIEVLLVLDATTGQNAIVQAKEFKQVADLTGIVLTKLDGTAKGGIILAIKHELNIPVKYIGVGESIDDIQKFSAKDFANALFSDS